MHDDAPVGSWNPAHGPLHRYLSPRPRTAVAVGGGMLTVAVVLVAMAVIQRDRLVEEWFAVVVLVVLVVFLGGLGLAAIAGTLRGGRAEIAIGPHGITSNRLSPDSWVWGDLYRVSIDVALRREAFVTTLEPKILRTRATIEIVLQPTATVGRSPARIRVVAPTFTTGENIPIVRDLDAALRAYGGLRYAGVSEQLRHTL
ncbi:hypothetical protein [Mumia sp. Pv 4-285]|uniref:hypothetical protein n=1 Tax=Mumia qirimensis TaxID=3234852 RepID=UPI00351D3453